MIMKKIFTLIAALACFGSIWAQKAIDIMPVDEIFDVITYRYITLANEEADAKAAIDNYVKHFTAYGYTHELVGEGYGGPCSIIDSFYKDGVNDTNNYTFVPEPYSYESNVVVITACNNGGEGDFGYLSISFDIYSEDMALILTEQLTKGGFAPEVIEDTIIMRKDNKCVTINESENGDFVSFLFEISE